MPDLKPMPEGWLPDVMMCADGVVTAYHGRLALSFNLTDKAGAALSPSHYKRRYENMVFAMWCAVQIKAAA